MTELVATACRTCGSEFSDTEERIKSYRCKCLTCRREYARKYQQAYRQTDKHKHYISGYYSKNKEQYNERSAGYKKTIRRTVDGLKSAPCLDCKTSFPPCVMDFDHVRGTKVASVGHLERNGSLKQILEEIAKCELVCSNCHRIRTQKRLNDRAQI